MDSTDCTEIFMKQESWEAMTNLIIEQYTHIYHRNIAYQNSQLKNDTAQIVNIKFLVKKMKSP